MNETPLSTRQILAVLLIFVLIMAGLTLYISLDSRSEPLTAAARQVALISALVVGLTATWLGKLTFDAIQDRRRGVQRGPSKVSGLFHIWFGALAASGGMACTALSYSSASWPGGIYTIYTGFILWA